MSGELMSAAIAAIVSLFVAVSSAWAAINRFKREYLLEFQAERLLRRLLSHPQWRLRTFKTIKYHVAGFDDDELRRTLIRCGAVRFQDNQGVEIWGLVERNSDLLEKEHGTSDN